jgi:Tfp pilus assembly protein PilO
MAENEQSPKQEGAPEIVVNQYGQTKDPAVVVEEANRTVLLTPDQTLVIEREPAIDIVPKDRPRTVYAGMWGRNEIVTFGLGIFALLVVVLIFVFLVIPSNRELARHRTEAQNLKEVQSTADARYGDVNDTRSQVVKLISSEEDFESHFLPPAETGRNALYQRLNGLIDAYGLVNTTGPDYSPLDSVEQTAANNQSDEERGREKFRSLFPGVYVSMTVDGSYQNLRRFIKEIETGQDFVVISAVQLAPSDNQSQQPKEAKPVEPQQALQNDQVGPNFRRPVAPGFSGVPMQQQQAPPMDNTRRPQGKTHGEVVSLHLEMAAYFRRPNFGSTVSQ